VFGLKVAQQSKLRQIQRQLIASLAGAGAAGPAPARARHRTAAVGS